MARNTKFFTITDEGRDKGKVFKLTELSSRAAERWANRVLFSLMNAGVEVPENLRAMGVSGLVSVGIKALGSIPFHIAEPLLDEMMQCVELAPNPSDRNILRPYSSFVESDIEEIATIYKLRKEVVGLHTDFFTRAKS
jgi:hypothetical protein